MLILDFIEERDRVKKNKIGIFKKRFVESSELNRYTININNKVATVLELTEKDLLNEDVLTLLKIYKGRVLIPEKYNKIDILNEYLFCPEEYYQRALLSSLVNQIKTVNKDWKRIALKIDEFTDYKELYELVKVSKTVTLITEETYSLKNFQSDCYYEYGAIVSVENEVALAKYDVFLDFNNIDKKGKLIIKAEEKEYLLYPDATYFENYSEYQKLMIYDIEHNLVCSAFSAK